MLGAFGFGGLGRGNKAESEKRIEATQDEGITLKEFLEKQRELELEAAAALPFKFDQCSAELGPLRQNLHICHNCPAAQATKGRPLAFCYACAIACHDFDPEKTGFDAEIAGLKSEKTDSGPAGVIPETAASIDDVFDAYGSDEPSQSPATAPQASHSIEEIWARRNFLCDCPSTGLCKLLQATPDAFRNHSNSYTTEHNFRGRYCVCDGAGWSVGDRTMYQCEICEDWFHDDCVAYGTFGGEIPREDAFNDFICKSCVQIHLKFFSKLSLKGNPFISTSPIDLKLPAPLFLLAGWRENLRTAAVEGDLQVSQKIGHLLRDEEIVYEPPIDTEATESLYDRNPPTFERTSSLISSSPFLVGLKALEQSAPRDQAILGIKLIDSLKDRLKLHLDSIAAQGNRSITAEDIRTFFDEENLRRKRAKFQ